jgi:AraC-like DNA-binding protein
MLKVPRFESWDLSAPALPRRSRLFGLEPIGIGTAFVEGLTGYVSRLAAAHSVSVGDLVGRELGENGPGSLPLVHPARRLAPGRRSSHCFMGASYSLNGTGEATRLWIDVLQAKTCRTELRMLTLLPLEEIFSETGLFRKRRAWCADCFRLWRRRDVLLYEPLLWSLRAATICPLHRRPLQEHCPWCNHSSRPLAIFTRPGHCSRCQRWLGIRFLREDQPRPNGEVGVDYAFWVATALGALLGAAPQLPAGRIRTAFRENLQWLAERFAGGNFTAFAQGVSMNFSVLYPWLKGEYIPCLDGLLQLCEKLNTSPMHLLSPGGIMQNVDAERIERMMRNGPGHRKRFPDAAEIHRELQAAARQVPPPPLTRLAHRLGFEDAARLYQVDANLCKRISRNYRRSPCSYWWRQKEAQPICSVERMKEALETALMADNPPSTKHLSIRLGYADDRLMRNRFPDLCAAIGLKRRDWKSSLPVRIRPAIQEALLEDPPPSLLQIARRVGIDTITTLKKHCPSLPHKLAARQAAFGHARDAHRRAVLEQALTENPAPCLAAVAKRLRLSRCTLNVQFHDLCAAIGERYRSRFSEVTGRRQAGIRRTKARPLLT